MCEALSIEDTNGGLTEWGQKLSDVTSSKGVFASGAEVESAKRAREELGIPEQCPHESYTTGDDNGVELCIFHLSDSRREELGIDSEEVESEFLNKVSGDKKGEKVFVNANLPKLNLERLEINSEDNKPVDLRFSNITHMSLDNTKVDVRMLFSRSLLEGCSFFATEFTEGANFTSSTFVGDEINFSRCHFAERAEFENAKFNATSVSFKKAVFGDDATFSDSLLRIDGVTEGSDVSFGRVVFNGEADFEGIEVRADMESKEYGGIKCDFTNCVLNGNSVSFADAEFGRRRDGLISGHDETSAEDEIDAVSYKGSDFSNSDVRFERAFFAGSLSMEEADLNGGENVFSRIIVEDEFNVKYSEFSGRIVSFTNSDFGKVYFENATLENINEVDFKGAEAESANFKNTTVSNINSFNFKRLEVRGDLTFENSVIRCRRAVFDETHIGDAVDFSKVTFRIRRFSFCDSALDGVVRFKNADITGTVLFNGTVFRGDDIDFTQMKSASAEFSFKEVKTEGHGKSGPVISFVESDILDGTFTQPSDSRTYYDFTRAEVGDIDIELDGTETGTEKLFVYFRFVETEFNGFDFSDSQYRKELKRNNWRLHSVEPSVESTPGDTGKLSSEFRKYTHRYITHCWRLVSEGSISNTRCTPDEIEATYRKAKIGADGNGDSKASSEFFQKELYHRRRSYGRRIWLRESEGDTSKPIPSSVDKIALGWRWIKNWLLWLTSGYGEKTSRVISSSLATVLLFAGVYKFIWEYTGTQPPSALSNRLSDSLILSVESFTQILLLGQNTSQALNRSVAYIEGFVGGFFIALFVLTITRSVRR